MNWFYAENDKQVGPVEASQLLDKFEAGELTPDTLVIRRGMTEWVPYHSTVDAITADAAGQNDGSAEVAIRTSNRDSLRGKYHYAGFWIRLGGALIDGILVQTIYYAVGLVAALILGVPLSEVMQPTIDSDYGVLVMLWGIVLGLFYYTFMIGRFGATVGMMAVGVRVIKAGGGKVSYPRALGRYLASFLSALIFGIGYLMIAFDAKKRALHDHICNTRVIKANE